MVFNGRWVSDQDFPDMPKHLKSGLGLKPTQYMVFIDLVLKPGLRPISDHEKKFYICQNEQK